MRSLKIIGVDVFLEKRKTRLHVGFLSLVHGNFVFSYCKAYFKAKNIIPLGPEFPLTQKKFSSEKLFPSLEDRIPSQQNPAYSEYCAQMGIDPNEQDPMILLSTIGQKGPSSFVFNPIFERTITAKNLIEFRQFLGLTTREFASVFEFSQSSLNAFERQRSPGKDILKRIEILLDFHEVALEFLLLNRGYITHEKWIKAVESIKTKFPKYTRST